MAEEITVSASLEFSKNGAFAYMAVKPKLVNVSGTQYFEGTKTITTSDTSLPANGITGGGWFFAVNLDKTNYVEVVDAAGVAIGKMLPGEPYCVRTTSAFAFKMKANTASCDVKFLICSA